MIRRYPKEADDTNGDERGDPYDESPYGSEEDDAEPDEKGKKPDDGTDENGADGIPDTEDDDGRPKATPVSEDDVKDVDEIKLDDLKGGVDDEKVKEITQAFMMEVDNNYTIKLNAAGDGWYVRDDITDEYLTRKGRRTDDINPINRFSDKMDVYKLIKEKGL